MTKLMKIFTKYDKILDFINALINNNRSISDY